MNLLLKLLLPEILILLQSTVKNPQSVKTEIGILTEVRDSINVILAEIAPVASAVPKPDPSGVALLD